MNLRQIKGKAGQAIKTVGMIGKGLARKAFTNANITDQFPDMKKKTRVMSEGGYMINKKK